MGRTSKYLSKNRRKRTHLRPPSGFSRTQKRQLNKLLTEAVGERDAEGRAIIDFDEIKKKADKLLGITVPNPMEVQMNRIMEELNPKEESKDIE